jgi:hypothetical protein
MFIYNLQRIKSIYITLTRIGLNYFDPEELKKGNRIPSKLGQALENVEAENYISEELQKLLDSEMKWHLKDGYITEFRSIIKELNTFFNQDCSQIFREVMCEDPDDVKKSWFGSPKNWDKTFEEWMYSTIDALYNNKCNYIYDIDCCFTEVCDNNVFSNKITKAEEKVIEWIREYESEDDEDEDCLQYFTVNGENLKDLYENATND